ncbi:hypothetical protein [Herpetosiphon llansteffanensis]|uniref:hypothetical protein n=1 Tax=Herpetosiphon llansteffanensis TaxID=2094568 RepID=UPI000D7C37AA|nr:hypothetical protein [Herpetosiphon llansteffanensis]
MDSIFPFLVFVGLVGLTITFLVFEHKRSVTLIQQWANANGYRIIALEQRWLRRGPFFWRSGKNQTVFYVDVIDPQGMARALWIRCGGWFMGLFSDQLDVRPDA